MRHDSTSSRRMFLRTAGLTVGSLSLGNILTAAEPTGAPPPPDDDKVSPAEDLMREHGILKRVLLIYNEIDDRFQRGADVPPATLLGGATIIRDFIENYHEKLEEDFLFPRLEKAHRLPELVRVLREQHNAGRALTNLIVSNATHKGLSDEKSRRQTLVAVRQFVRMYNPHEAREDTVLFPEFRKIVSQNEYDSLGEEFEDKEHALFGDEGFEKYVGKVAEIEKTLGIYDLAIFTPRVEEKS